MIKHGIVGFGRSLALYLAPDIRVNVLCPGAVQTPMLDGFFDRDPAVDPEVLKKTYVTGAVPLRRAGDADEVADVAVFLASDRSSFMTGTVVPVDGGYTTR
jgi:NAD(P)-dependent dehydrogenase (short-subunit alcohol dehydrogenase family)